MHATAHGRRSRRPHRHRARGYRRYARRPRSPRARVRCHARSSAVPHRAETYFSFRGPPNHAGLRPSAPQGFRERTAVVKTRLTEQFGIRHPILSAPMALIAGGRLVAAVSDAGGLGILGGGYAGALGGEPDLEKELALVKSRKFGVGFISWALDRAPQALDAALKHSPYCVFLSFGQPK